MSIEIIAEIGINANGSVELAKDLIKMAKECGCDYVKFQKRDIETVYSKGVLDSPRKSPWGNTTRDQKRGLEFGKSEYQIISEFCESQKMPWFASAWDIASLEFLDEFKLPHNKIASAMITHCDFLKAVAERKRHTFVSTGMSSPLVIERAVDIFVRAGCPYTLMHGVSEYPVDDEKCNLAQIPLLISRYGPPVGYSSHDVGLKPSIIAVVLGATVIEKHVTLSRALYGSDQAASMERHGLELLVRDCKSTPACIGEGRKIITEKEQEVSIKLRYWREDGFVSDNDKSL